MSNIENWNEEMQSAYLYRIVADVENDKQKSSMFIALADAAEEQAGIWSRKMRDQGEAVPLSFRPEFRARCVAWLIRNLGPRAIKPVLAASKVRGISVYGGSSVLTGHVMPTSVEEIGHRHSVIGSGGNLRAAVFGVNDGLVSNASLVMGVAGATADGNIIFMTGVAGLIAGAASMAAGEFISVRSQRELYEYQIRLEREELEQYPEEEAEELALIYNARGLPMEEARKIATDLLQDPEHALDTLTREELGLNPDDLGSPAGAALASFASFAAGALIPLLPFLFGDRSKSIPLTVLLTALSLFVVGAVLSLFTGKDAMKGGLRMLLIGACAGLVTYSIGILLGISLL